MTREIPTPPECYVIPRNRTTHRLMDLVCDERNLGPQGFMRHARRLHDHLTERMALYGPHSVQDDSGQLDIASALDPRENTDLSRAESA